MQQAERYREKGKNNYWQEWQVVLSVLPYDLTFSQIFSKISQILSIWDEIPPKLQITFYQPKTYFSTQTEKKLSPLFSFIFCSNVRFVSVLRLFFRCVLFSPCISLELNGLYRLLVGFKINTACCAFLQCKPHHRITSLLKLFQPS